MAPIKTKGIVIRCANAGDHGKILTVLTENMGKISIAVKGAHSMKRGIGVSMRAFCYSEFVLTSHQKMYSLSQCTAIETFYGLSSELGRLQAAASILKFADSTTYENEDASLQLRIVLNCLHILSQTGRAIEEVFLVFHLRCLSVLGVLPDFSACNHCGSMENLVYYAKEEGGAVCDCCAKAEDSCLPMEPSVRSALVYIANVPLEKVFSFEADLSVIQKANRVVDEMVRYSLGLQPCG